MVRLIYDNTKNGDMFYAVGVKVHDPFFYFDAGDKKYVFLDQRDAGVFEEKNKNKEIELVLLDSLIKDLRANNDNVSGACKLGHAIIKKYNPTSDTVKVPGNFSLQLADYLREKGIKLAVEEDFFPERHCKNAQEIESIKESLSKTQLAFERIEEILEKSEIKGDEIWFGDILLDSEFLKSEAEKTLLENGLIDTEGMIISSGKHSAIPHHTGSGSIKPHEPIICDIFPKHRESNFFADITRTYVKGEPSKYFKKMYETVLLAQEEAIGLVKGGVISKDVHDKVVELFLKKGFHVGEKGFIHSTGHSLGLDVHDGLRIGSNSDHVFEPGNVFTIEPGLYYPDYGGVRIEDVVLVTENGCENLTNHHKNYLIS